MERTPPEAAEAGEEEEDRFEALREAMQDWGGPRIIIGLSGKMGAGKDTVADAIQALLPEFGRRAFGTAIKRCVAILTGTLYETQASREGKALVSKGFTESNGRLQQLVGDGMRECLGEEVWIRALMDTEVRLPRFAIITDCRTESEAWAIMERGGAVVRVDRGGGGATEESGDGRDTAHSTEVGLDGWAFHWVLRNDGTVEELRHKVAAFLLEYMAEKLRGPYFVHGPPRWCVKK